MELHELSKQYGVSMELLQEFLEAGLLDDRKSFDGIQEEQRLKACICLHALGMDGETIQKYLLLEESKIDTRAERKQILQAQRDSNLKHLHKIKETMDCIDCMLQEYQNRQNEE